MAKKVRMLRATKDYVSLPAKGQSASKEGSISKKKCIAARPANARCANEANDGAPVTDRSPADPGKWMEAIGC